MTQTNIYLGRRLPVDGTYNLRELGGYRAGDAAVRQGKFFRSDGLHMLTPTGKTAIADLGVRRIIDLRSDDETVADRTELPEIEIVHAPIFTAGQPTVMPEAPRSISDVYDDIIDEHGEQLTNAVRLIATSGDAPVLVHCTAGKDRTGLVVALTLLALGVPREDVVADYALTEGYLAGPWVDRMIAKMLESGYPQHDDTIALVATSPATLTERIIDRWESEWGSGLEYLTAHGFSAADRSALSAAVLKH
ncbi:MAG: tyrosine-protein phosphatase [Cumulibacter sp.]